MKYIRKYSTPFQKKKKKKMSHFHGLAPPVNEKALPAAAFVSTTNQPIYISPTTYKASNENLRKVRHRTQSKRMENCEISNERHPLLLFVTFFYIPPPLPPLSDCHSDIEAVYGGRWRRCSRVVDCSPSGIDALLACCRKNDDLIELPWTAIQGTI